MSCYFKDEFYLLMDNIKKGNRLITFKDISDFVDSSLLYDKGEPFVKEDDKLRDECIKREKKYY